MRTSLLLFTMIGLGCGERRFFEAPPEISYIAWIEIEGTERIVSSSPLTPIDEAPVWVIDEERSVFFVGFEAEVIDPLLLRPEAAGWRGMPLTNAERCDLSIEPSWSTSVLQGDARVPPLLTAPWLAGACNERGVDTPACAFCSGECELEVIEHTLAFNGDVPTNVIVGGLIRLDDSTLMATLQSGETADHVAVISLTEQGDPITTVQAHRKITTTIAYDGNSPYIGDESGRVIRLAKDGTAEAIIQTTPQRPILVSAFPGSAVYAFQYGGAALQVGTSSATVLVEVNPPVYDVAVDLEREFYLRYDELRSYGRLLIQERVPLPTPVPHEEFNVADRARIAIVGGDILFAWRNSPVYRLEGAEWIELDWPQPNENTARAFVELDGGILMGGQEGQPLAIGLLYYQRGGLRCQAAFGKGRINALVTTLDRKVAYAVTEGIGRPFFLEIRVK